MDIKKIIASKDSEVIARAIIALGDAYLDSMRTKETPNPAMPWGNFGGKFFVFSKDPASIEKLYAVVEANDTKVIVFG